MASIMNARRNENEVYEPREDSFLLEKAVGENAFGRVLDLGTGSGIQAIAAARKPEVTGVIAVDVNPKALAKAEENAAKEGEVVLRKIKFVESDLFSELGEEKFDTIAFNPPYLPASEGPDGEKTGDMALESGESGRELTDRFLGEFEKHLQPGGILLLLQSSVSGWKETREILGKKGFSVSVEGSRRFFFEEIVVLKATLETGKTAG